MKSTSTSFLREQLYYALHHCRLGTLKLFEGIDAETFCAQPHPDFSPVGWHLGHIAHTEAYWWLEQFAGLPPVFPDYHSVFRADGLPKTERVCLPALDQVKVYLDTVRQQVWNYLAGVPLDQQERLWRFLLQHESQHTETIAFILQLRSQQQTLKQGRSVPSPDRTTSTWSRQQQDLVPSSPHDLSDMVQIPAGEFWMGHDGIEAMDNEKPAHRVQLETYWIDRYPVTCGQYRQFISAGGYQTPQWWSTAGWNWLQQESVNAPIRQPCYWLEEDQFADHPVCGVSWYEAEAYCNFLGKRLPTEAEWEKAASWDNGAQQKRVYPWGATELNGSQCNCAIHDTLHGTQQGQLQHYQVRTTPVYAFPQGVSAYGVWDLLGNVWEWTSSWFQGYPGFQVYPYPGYSQVYFDDPHRVLKGGSWATRPWAMRNSFRNWYYPEVRQILSGFRCAKSNSEGSQQMTPRQIYLRTKMVRWAKD